MAQTSQIRTYDPTTSVVFQRTKERFGGLSNMAPNFPLKVNGIRIRTSEALYQACRFPHRPDVQRRIIDELSPMTAKMRSKAFRKESRSDWDTVRVKIMRWCLRVKLAQNWRAFSELLLQTGDRPIVEQSRKDDFWGAKLVDERTLVGLNVLGQLLMELREAVKEEDRNSFLCVQPLALSDFMLGGRLIKIVTAKDDKLDVSTVQNAAKPPHSEVDRLAVLQPSLFDVRVVKETTSLVKPVVSKMGVNIANLKPYPAMKDSGVACLGSVPVHWDVVSLRRKLRLFDGIKIGPFGSQLKLEQMVPSGYKVYGQANVIAKDFVRGTKFVEQEKFNELSACVVLPGDLLVTMMGTSGRCACVPDDAVMGIMDSHLLRLRTNGSLNVRFVSLLIDESPYVKEQITVAGKGSIMHGLNSGIVKALVLALPPLPEQTAIVRFLDYADRRIRRYIRAKQKLITLLEEQKEAIIHQAVTGQIDVRTGQPYPAYKPSGVEWLGNVPAHWGVKRVKQATEVLRGKFTHRPRNDPSLYDGPYPFIQTGEVARAEKAITSYRQTLNQRGLAVSQMFPAGTLAMTIAANIGDVAVIEFEACFPDSVVGFVPRNNIERDFLYYAFRAMRPELLREAPVNTQGNLNVDRIGSRGIAVGPAIEQRLVVRQIEASTAVLNTTANQTQRAIDLLREYRTRLIADVVTGKLDVREAAATLPAVDPLEADDELDEPIDEDAEADSDGLDTTAEEVEA